MRHPRWLVGALMALPMVLGGAQAAHADAPGAMPEGWTERTVLERSVPVTVNIPTRDLLTIDGRARATDPRMYDIDIKVNTQSQPTISVFTGSALQAPLHLELLKIAQKTVTATVKAFYRYDPKQPVCLVGLGSTCAAHLGFDPTRGNWASSQSASQAELIVEVRVDTEAGMVADQFVRIPLVGQVVGGL